ncbi:peroxidase [Corallococcus sp. H22C18031201]|nr:peroxidase [Corallococcus sp. H22C18031201]
MLQSPDKVHAVLRDASTAPISDAEKALFAFIDTLNLRSSALGRSDVDALRAVGWTDEAIYDAITVCALFNFYNRWIDGSGVQDMSTPHYQASGRRLAEFGYAPPEDPPDSSDP